ncbi:MAG: CCXG family PEP-CTERM protein [Oleispira sp.]
MFFRYLPFILLILTFSHISYARQACDWPFRTTITINETSGISTSNYLVKLTLSGNAGGTLSTRYDWSSDGADLRIFGSNDTTPLPFSIASWNQANKIAEVWVTFATLNANSSNTLYVYYGNNAVTTADGGAPPTITYVNNKIKFHTRYNTTDPSSFNQAKSLFDSQNDSKSGYGCSHPNTYSNIRNSTQNSNGASVNFIAYSTALFTVPTTDTWGVRYGADYGLGGALYIDGTPLDERWNEDLWWGGSNWNNKDVLTGTRRLTAGEHKLELLGAEGGNDGGLSIQFKKNGSNWITYDIDNPANNLGITIRSEACPVVRHTIQYGAHDICGVDLTTSNSNFNIPSVWEHNVPQNIAFRIQNTSAAVVASSNPIQVSIELPAGMNLSSFSGTDWSNCIQSSNKITCNYNATINRNANSSLITLSLFPSPSTATGSRNIIITPISNFIDLDANNNIRTTTITIENNNALAAVIPSCIEQSGTWGRFFDTTGYTGSGNYPKIITAADMQTFINDNKTASKLDGQTILSRIYGLENPFNNATVDSKDDYFLAIFEGYIKVPSTNDYTFDVDGDDAIEFRLGGSIISTFYGLHPEKNVPQNPKTVRLAAGFHAIEFRMQEHTGGAVYRLYSREGGGSIRSSDITPTSYFYHCAGNTNIEMSSQLGVLSDDINGATFAKAIPNSIIKYTVTSRNKGNISTDNGSTIITQEIDDNSEFYVKDLMGAGDGPIHFIDGSSPNDSGLRYSYNGTNGLNDSLWFSTDGATYTQSTDLSNDYNSTITHFQIRFDGSLKASFDAAEPYFTFEYQVRIK